MAELVSAINLLHGNRLMLPAVMMTFASIDIFAALARPSENVESNSNDFRSWAEQYLLPGSKLACTAEELWAARCGLLHTYTPDSRSVRKGKAAKMLYVAGVLEESARPKSQFRTGDYVIVVSQDLFSAMSTAMQRFVDEMKNDANLSSRVLGRAAEFLVSAGPDMKPLSILARTRHSTRRAKGACG